MASARSRVEDTDHPRAVLQAGWVCVAVSIGSLVNPGTVITTLDDVSVIKLDFAVPENFLAGLREGLKVSATAAAFPGREFAGDRGWCRLARRSGEPVRDGTAPTCRTRICR